MKGRTVEKLETILMGVIGGLAILAVLGALSVGGCL